VASLFAAFNIEDGTVISELRRRHQEFQEFLKKIEKNVPSGLGLDVPLVRDNHGTHKTPAMQDWLARHPRFPVHFTPTGQAGSTKSSAGSAPHRPEDPPRRPQVRPGLEADIRAWTDTWNENPRPFAWTKTAEDGLNSLAEYLSKISGGAH
jgi:hypothetical protein